MVTYGSGGKINHLLHKILQRLNKAVLQPRGSLEADIKSKLLFMGVADLISETEHKNLFQTVVSTEAICIGDFAPESLCLESCGFLLCRRRQWGRKLMFSV